MSTTAKAVHQIEYQARGDRMRQVVVYPGEDGYWIAECPSLSGCISQGKTKEEAIANIKEAIEGYVAALEEDGLPVPEDHFDAIHAETATWKPHDLASRRSVLPGRRS